MILATQNQLRTSFGRRASFAPPLSTWFANSFTPLIFHNQFQIVFRNMKCALCPPFSTWPTWPARKLSMRTPTCGTRMKMKTTSGTLRLRTRTISTLAIQTRNPQAPQQIIRLSEFFRSSFSLSWNKVGLGIFFSDNSKFSKMPFPVINQFRFTVCTMNTSRETANLFKVKHESLCGFILVFFQFLQ